MICDLNEQEQAEQESMEHCYKILMTEEEEKKEIYKNKKKTRAFRKKTKRKNRTFGWSQTVT